jgi:hypothetical protein
MLRNQNKEQGIKQEEKKREVTSQILATLK